MEFIEKAGRVVWVIWGALLAVTLVAQLYHATAGMMLEVAAVLVGQPISR